MSALCRNAATKIVSLELFVALYKHWKKLAEIKPSSHETHESNASCDLNDVSIPSEMLQTYVRCDKSGLSYILDLIRDRLFPSDLKMHKYDTWMSLATILKVCQIEASPVQTHALRQFFDFARIGVLNNISEKCIDSSAYSVNVAKLQHTLSIINPHRPIDNEATENVVIEFQSNAITRLLRLISPFATAIIEILKNMTSVVVNGNFSGAGLEHAVIFIIAHDSTDNRSRTFLAQIRGLQYFL